MGYVGYSMSINAYECYEKGMKPLSKWTKSDIIECINEAIKEGASVQCNIEALKKLKVNELKRMLLVYEGWHHTSSYYNKTEFYSFGDILLTMVTDEEIKNTIEGREESKKEEPQEIKARCKYLEWVGTRKHPKAIKHEAIGIIKGNWFFLENGKKKSINANGFEILEEIKK